MLGEDEIVKLCKIHDIRQTFVSVYAKKSDGWNRYLRKRERECIKALENDKELLENFEICVEKIKNDVEDMKGPYCCFFYSHLKNFYYRLDIPSPVPSALVVDSSPYIIHLVQTLEDWELYAILLIDNAHAILYTARGDEISIKETMTKDIMAKHKKGGMSQRRFQRKREIEIEHFFKNVSENFSNIVFDKEIKRIVIAGPSGPKERFISYLPKDIRSKIIGVISESIDISQQKLLHDTEKIYESAELDEEKELDNYFRYEIMKGHMASYDINEIINASHSGRIEVLLVEKGKIIRGWKCEKCDIFGYGNLEYCSICNSKTLTVNAVEEIIEEVEKHRGDVEFLSEPAFLSKLGGIGAIMRY